MNLGPDGSVRLTVLGEHVAWLREHAETILWASRDRKARHIFNYAAMRLEVAGFVLLLFRLTGDLRGAL